ncbi:MAG: hypothetical protein QOF21_410 [Actinomycetota bacterium]|jgi:DNA-binding CsgD family transcriptional regulator
MGELVGRATEMAALDRFLAQAEEHAAACVVEGAAGMGKSALVQYGVDAARDKGWRVLVHCPAAPDAELALVGLTDLFASVEPDLLASLAPPLRVALEVVFLRREPVGQPPDARTVATAVTAALARLCEDGPLLVAIDDALWLDLASARALAFAARRLLDRPLGWLVAARRPEQTGVPLDLDHVIPSDAFTALEVGSLSVAAMFHVVQERLGITLSRPNLLRVHDASAGNALFAIELARGLAASHVSQPTAPLDVPASLHDVLATRIAAVSTAGRAALLIAAAARNPTVATVVALSSSAGLDAAEEAGVVRIDDGRVLFEQPLLRSAVYAAASLSGRREAHAALAAVVIDAEERARHLALASVDVSEEVAAALETAAHVARARGAADVAADLAELSLARTPDATSDDAWRRRLVLADFLFDAGAARRAVEIVGLIDVADAPAAMRVAALRLQAIVVFETEGTDAALTHLTDALNRVGDPAVQIEGRILIARITEDSRQAAEFAEGALALLDAVPQRDVGQLAEATLASAVADFRLGRGLDRARFDRAVSLEGEAGATRKASDSAHAALSALLKYADYFAEAHEALLEEYHAAVASGDESGVAGTLTHLPQVELFLGNWSQAKRWADEHLAAAQQTEQVGQMCAALCNVAMVEAHLGELDTAADAAQHAIRLAAQQTDVWNVERASALLGFIALSNGDAVEAVARYAPAWDGLKAAALLEPGYARWPADFVEALVGAGELERAQAVLDDVGARADAVDRASIRATTARGRALLAAARGDLATGAAFVDSALVQHARADIPFERGRTLLVKGQIHRRAKEKLLARTALDAAVAVFDELGAKVWAERARDELRRVNIRPGAPLDLTESERRVAELAASGLTNKQVAEAAFISPKTVEANLARVYRKLGISSRAELGQRMSQT